MRMKKLFNVYVLLSIFSLLFSSCEKSGIDDNGGLTDSDSIPVEDELFLKWLVLNYDADNDGTLSLGEAKTITSISIGPEEGYNEYGAFIESLDGIEYMTNLESLRIEACDWDNVNGLYTGKLKKVDLSKNVALKELYLTYCPLNELNVSSLVNLEKLDCSSCFLESLDLSNNTRLTHLRCGMDNALEELDLTNNPELIELCCGHDGTGRIFVQDYPEGRDLMHGNKLTRLDLSRNTKLEVLDCVANFLTELDLSANTNLKVLYCSANKLTKIDLSRNQKLVFADMGTDLGGITFPTHLGNYLSSMDFSNHPELENLRLSANSLTHLGLSGCPKLRELICDHNELQSIDISGCKNLTSVLCDYNKLTEMDFSSNQKLSWISCAGNGISEIDLTANTELSTLNMDYTLIEELNLDNYQQLRNIDCSYTPLNNLKVSGCPLLEMVYIYENKCQELDFSSNPNIDTFKTSGSPSLKTIWVSEDFDIVEHDMCEIDSWTELKVKGQ